MSYVVCYTNMDTGAKSYTITDDYENVQLPDQCHIDFVFDKDKEILEYNETAEEMFAIQSNMFGFTPADYKREFKDHAGRTLILVSFLPRNIKYKCRAFEPATGKYFKMSPGYVRQCLSLSETTK